MVRKTFLYIGFGLGFLLIVAILVLGYLTMTVSGLAFLVNQGTTRFLDAESVTVGSMHGTLVKGAIFKDIRITNPRGLPDGTLIAVQELRVDLNGIDWKAAEAALLNGRIMLPVSDNIVVFAKLKSRTLDVHVFSPGLKVGEIVGLIPKQALWMHALRGTLTKVDIKIRGSLDTEIGLNGAMHIDELTRDDFKVSDTPLAFELALARNTGRAVDLKGEVVVDHALIEKEATKVELKKSTVYFSGDPKNPALALEGFSEIGNVFINIGVTGTAKKPVLDLSSEPPLTQDELMVMLATGREWAGVHDLKQGQISEQFAKEFLGYLLFPGGGDGFLAKAGIKDVELTYEDGARGIGFKKEVSKTLDVGYEIQQKGGSSTTAPGVDPQMYHAVGVDYRVSNKLFLTVEKKLQAESAPADQSAGDDRMMLKFKKRF